MIWNQERKLAVISYTQWQVIRDDVISTFVHILVVKWCTENTLKVSGLLKIKETLPK